MKKNVQQNVESCTKGEYEIEGGQKVCKCMTNTTCKDCPSSGNPNNLCKTCNEGYYPKAIDSSNEFKSCYNSDSITKDYVLISDKYEQCYESCAECYDIVKPNNHNLIAEKKKCIKNCKDDNIFNYIYEYDGTCVQSCSEGQYTIDGQIVCKCMKNPACQDCPSSGNPGNLCKTCNIGYYPKAIESSNEFKSCYNGDSITKNYVLIGDKYELCYESCAECDDKGTPENHNCKICKTGYSKLNNGKDNNCYPDCNNYYYFNESNLIAEKKKCIKNCKDDNIFNYIYEYDGTCVQSCSAGDYTIDGQKVCKCMKNTACQDCPSSGNPNNLCKTCNEGYYPKSEESNKNLKQCYNDGNKPSNYIFDSNLYKRCYESCGTCTEIGDSSNHKCGDCASGYKRHDNEHNDNCYPICDYYFYFDDNHGVICTENQACPPNYKLVYSTTKCVKNCMDDGLYEYNNVCYQSCPYGHYSNEEGINTCTCMSNAECKVCNEDNSCLSCNNINGYYHKKEESENSIKNCYNTAPQKYFLNESTSQYEPCYSSCKTCESSGTTTNHNCADCIDNYLKINLDNNCYQNCGENYYYFNANNEYACSDKVGCPGDYKWIESTKKCISKCKDDDMYNKKFEYKNVCYENCPNEYYTKDGINICKCKTNIACKDCDEHGSCYSCNNDKGYYHKKEESENEIKTCYNNASIGKNYIFNSSALRYDPCYESCEECDIIGTEDNHQCKKCKEGYSNLKNNNNCYQDCVHYYYFDEHNKYFCLDVDTCPDNYKLIDSEKECIRNCKLDFR